MFATSHVKCEDLNLDVEILKIRWDPDGKTIETRQHIKDDEESTVPVRLVLETYSIESNEFQEYYEKKTLLQYNEVLRMIRNEVSGW